jgi:hypothetical protein
MLVNPSTASFRPIPGSRPQRPRVRRRIVIGVAASFAIQVALAVYLIHTLPGL